MINEIPMTSNKTADKRAVIVCSHVAKDRLPILYAGRSEPLELADSGWQCLCYAGFEEQIETAKVWSIDELLTFEPSLAAFIDSPIGTKMIRKNTESQWIKYKDRRC